MRDRLLGPDSKIDPESINPNFHESRKIINSALTQDSDSTAVEKSDRDHENRSGHYTPNGHSTPDGRHTPDEGHTPDGAGTPNGKGHDDQHHHHHTHNDKKKKRFGDRLTLPHQEGWGSFLREERERAKGDVELPFNEAEKMVRSAHDEVEHIIQRRHSRTRSHESGIPHFHDPDSEKTFIDDEEKAQQLESKLVQRVMQLTIQLEAESRQMLLDSMDKGVARTLLLADRNGESQSCQYRSRTDTLCQCNNVMSGH